MNPPITVIAVLGILMTSIFMFIYYVLVIKCCLRCRQPNALLLSFYATPTSALKPSDITAIPTFLFPSPAFPSGTSPSECAVCLAEFHAGELLRLLPACGHAFHIECVDMWLQSSANCPLCRAAVVPDFNHGVIDIAAPARSEEIEVVVEMFDEVSQDATPETRKMEMGHADEAFEQV
ncbi:hypothetical protein HPP92_002415 [Vanilla planifolia]|uniref:RING-type E3 ubiquitin transferase n=1 Tax=Vanilla planifolia TaxID=51239 RepID=A0A835VEH9_VANPL|nr:hypothetical protein HPP92_002415 [Vanilla planifolia]